MRYPCLVNKRFCTTPITAVLEREGVDKYGEPLETVTVEAKCNYQDVAKTIYTAEKKLVEVTGTAMFPGDIAPEMEVISGGTVTVFGVERQIARGMKARNPDGTVNYTRLDVV